MAQLPQGPYILDFTITIDGLSHSLELNCDTLGIADPGVSPDVLLMAARSAGEEVTLQDFADEFWFNYRNLITNLHLCSTFTLWKAGINNTVRTFISGGVLTTPNGVIGSPYVPAQQLTLTFRTASGRIGRLIALETHLTGSAKTPLNVNGVTLGADLMAAYVISERSPLCGRDRSFFVQALNASLGQNEAVWEDRFRS